MLGNGQYFSNKIIVNGADHAMKACSWCNKHINEKNWGVSVEFGKAVYTFGFNKPSEATVFALKWA